MDYPIPLTLHIGYPRTATTLLQGAMETQNPHILFLGRKVKGRNEARWTEPVLHTFWEWVKNDEGAVDVQSCLKEMDRIMRHAADNGKQAVVISDETMCKPRRRRWHKGLASRLHEIFPGSRVLLTLRDQVGLISSSYGLFLRTVQDRPNSAQPFEQWFAQGMSSYVPAQERFDYHACYQALLDNFGPDAISVLLYEDFAQHPQEYIKSLSGVLGVNDFRLDNKVIVNASTRSAGGKPVMASKKSASKGLRSLGRDWTPQVLLNRLCAARAREATAQGDLDPDYGLHPETVRTLRQLFFESNDRLAEMTGLDLAGHNYPSGKVMAKNYRYYGS